MKGYLKIPQTKEGGNNFVLGSFKLDLKIERLNVVPNIQAWSG